MTSRSLVLLSGLMIPICMATAEPAPPAPIKDGLSRKTIVHQVVPEYPPEARRSRVTGYGILFGQVDYKTGIVKSVRMEKSTGSTILDQAALNAFRQWRFKPGTIRQFRTPILFEAGGSREQAMERMRRLQAADAQRKK